MDHHAPHEANAGGTLARHLSRYRAAGFVGRERELAVLDDLLDASSPRRVLLVTGASGVGKTTLLGAFERAADRRGVVCARVDARDLPETADAMAAALDAALPSDPAAVTLLLIDTFEHATPRERWLREHYLPRLPDAVHIVAAGRGEPDAAWTTDPGWSALTRTCRLADFTRDEVAAYLRQHGLERAHADRVHQFTRGHPLAVALVTTLLTDDPERSLQLESTPEVVRALVGQYLDDAPGEPERRALYASGLARNLTEGMLTAMLGSDDVRGIFDWLRSRSFMRSGTHGLRPHELVGDALRVELEWREPRLHRELVRRAVDYLRERFSVDRSEAAVQDYLFSVREFPAMRRVFVVEQDTGLHTDVAGADDLPDLAGMVERHEGADSRAWFEHWARRRPAGITVLRTAAGEAAGFAFHIDISDADDAARADPAVRALSDHLARHAPLRPGEQAHLCRFVMAADTYQAPSPAMTQLLSCNALRPFRHPEVAFQASVRREDENARAQGRFAAVPPLTGCELRLDGRDYFLMGHDWRTEPPAAWIRNVTERILAARDDTAGDQRRGTVLDEAAFTAAVEAALRDRARGRGRGDNPLAQSCLARSLPDAGGDPDATVDRLVETGVAALRERGESEMLARVLDRTYLHPAPKQRAAAEALGLSYGTYRRRLREATRTLVEQLWRRELEAARTGRD